VKNYRQQAKTRDPIGREEPLLKKRRELLQIAGIGILGGLMTQDAKGARKPRKKFKVLGETDKLDIGDKGKEIIERAYEAGHEFEKKHRGCARCTVAALQKAVDFVPGNKALFRTASCLDGGATPKGVQSCGAFTGLRIVIGWVSGNGEFGDTKLSHKLMRKVHKRFEAEYGSVLCKDVRKKAKKDCPEVVGRAAMWTAEILLEQFTNYEQEKETSNG